MASIVSQWEGSDKYIAWWLALILRWCLTTSLYYVFFLLIAAEEDFFTLIELLDFPSDGSSIDVNITIINDGLTENSETFVIYLTSGPGVKLSHYAQTKVIISDDDGKNAYTVLESGVMLWFVLL